MELLLETLFLCEQTDVAQFADRKCENLLNIASLMELSASIIRSSSWSTNHCELKLDVQTP